MEHDVRLITGDCLDVLKTIESNSIDSVVCDPPYGLSKEPDIAEVLTHWLSGPDLSPARKDTYIPERFRNSKVCE